MKGSKKGKKGKRGKKALFALFALFAFFASPTDLQKTNPQRNYGALYLDLGVRRTERLAVHHVLGVGKKSNPLDLSY
ncbi:MAG: hypothetical protein MOB07_09920 [Acidobacteria bacterium]|nr:hypothetical protein [Acidobacteriota bacterium]